MWPGADASEDELIGDGKAAGDRCGATGDGPASSSSSEDTFRCVDSLLFESAPARSFPDRSLRVQRLSWDYSSGIGTAVRRGRTKFARRVRNRVNRAAAQA